MDIKENFHSKLHQIRESKIAKPNRSEYSWPTRRNRKTGEWMWGNSFAGGHASAAAADKHAKDMIEKNKRTKVNLSDLKPGSK